ncbi:Alkaline phosphatase-like alpha/beta/alpha [Penicillium vulpinum]|uniref:Alkaline phosphatase-like alpha/beta/alpha n=1 Tax=Penicillium vulpinum TaxID=29845 RepID=UPI002546C3C5|nr:Alkaline phosphatase-like alpha/beta/alpha [Penicillium vulpinum]KAJ5972662.1 Alkaline phosphatase-like alpha/beta/alpha [Penicillium vulpinum]
MAGFRSWTTVIANLLIPVGILTFSSGFFPYKPLLPGLASFDETGENDTAPAPAVFDKVIFMVRLCIFERLGFLVYTEVSVTFEIKHFYVRNNLIRSGAALPFTAYASSPTVTMPRLKAITTGSVPSFLDVILNIAESDTSSTLAYQDTWLAQIKATGGRLVMYGDDTWLKLFPGMFDRADGTTSFFVSDFTEVDHNVTRHVPNELAQDDWSALIMHYLGLDHIGHKAGPKSPFMIPKQHEMDSVVTEIYTAMQQQDHLQSTLFVLCGDHGMNEAGNHGGSSAGETSPALLFMSPKFEALGGKRESPVEPSGDMQYYQTVEQADIAPTLAGLLGIPIPLNSLGVFIPEFLEMWDQGKHTAPNHSKAKQNTPGTNPETGSDKLRILYQNAEQLLNTLTTTFPGSTFGPDSITSCTSGALSGIGGAECAWARVQQLLSDRDEGDNSYSTAGPALLQFLRIAQEVMSRTASNYDVSRLILGLLITGVAGLLVLPATYKECTRHGSSGLFMMLMVITCGMMMFASSYVEEEQQFWYWICSGWIVYLHIKSQSSANAVSRKRFGSLASWSNKCMILVLAITQRLLRRWNQTGQKFAAEPDIARTFFTSHPEIFWCLFILTYVDAGRHLLKRIPISGMLKLGALAPAVLSLVLHARLVFYGLAVVVLLALFVGKQSRVAQAPHDTIHEALHIFLMTQSRATNVPLFLIFRIQAGILSSMNLTGIEVTITTLIFQYMTFFAFGGSNAISSVDLASGYNGIGSYSVVLVGILTFASNWAGPIWWASQSHRLRPKNPAEQNPSALLTFHVAMSLVSVMAACTALRTHLFIWTVFSPKYLYSMAWATANHVAVNLLGEVIFSRSRSHYS